VEVVAVDPELLLDLMVVQVEVVDQIQVLVVALETLHQLLLLKEIMVEELMEVIHNQIMLAVVEVVPQQ
jgi:hypothetical protein